MKIKNAIVNFVNGMPQDTVNLSFTDRGHPAFYLVKKLFEKDKDLVIATLLKRMEKEDTWFFVIFQDIIPPDDRPEMSEDIRGKIKEQTEVWIKWGYEKGYLKND